MFIPVLKFISEIKIKSDSYFQFKDQFISYLCNSPSFDEANNICEYLKLIENDKKIIANKIQNNIDKCSQYLSYQICPILYLIDYYINQNSYLSQITDLVKKGIKLLATFQQIQIVTLIFFSTN
jgi:hypothetical protein